MTSDRPHSTGWRSAKTSKAGTCMATLTREAICRRWLSRVNRQVSGSKGFGSFFGTLWMQSSANLP